MTDQATYFTGRNADGSAFIPHHIQRDFDNAEAKAWMDAGERRPLLTWLALLLVRRAEKTPYFHLKGYMRRFWLRDAKPGRRISARVHHILRSDNDRVMHDHPWWNVSIVLRGGYYEWVPNPKAVTTQGTIRKWRGPGSIVLRRPTAIHRLELPANTSTWSLFIMGPKVREWGFHTPDGWVHWEKYCGALEHRPEESV